MTEIDTEQVLTRIANAEGARDDGTATWYLAHVDAPRLVAALDACRQERDARARGMQRYHDKAWKEAQARAAAEAEVARLRGLLLRWQGGLVLGVDSGLRADTDAALAPTPEPEEG